MVEVTEEMRRAVLAAECEAKGHDFSFSNTQSPVATGDDGIVTNLVMDLLAPDPTQLPHILCKRCGQVWLVLPVSGWGYEDAERAVYAMLRADSDSAQEIVRKRGQRAERRERRTTRTAVNLTADLDGDTGHGHRQE